MKILVINCGSSSIKYQLLNMANETVLAAGIAERIGESIGALSHRKSPGTAAESKFFEEEPIADHETGMRKIADLITGKDYGVIKNSSEILAVGHRVVHGGEIFRTPALIDHKVIKAIEKTSPLAPLHNPANLMGIKVAQTLFPGVPQVAIFDTAFHQTIPPYAFHYALPYEYYKNLGIRRYGFHGTSHQYVAKEAAKLMGKPLRDLNLITAHLGSGASICAIQKGKSVDTSMGMTPLGGVIMGTRVGNIDPGIITYLAERKGMTFQEINHVLQYQSGLKGICGSNDIRDIHNKKAKGDKRAKLALDMFVYRNRQYIGAYFTNLVRVDALVFTAGIGEHDFEIRQRCCENMEYFGVILDLEKNRVQKEGAFRINKPESAVQIFVIPTNEELEIARQTREVLEATGISGAPSI